MKPGGGRIVKCLEEHEKELSSECKAKMTGQKRKYLKEQAKRRAGSALRDDEVGTGNNPSSPE